MARCSELLGSRKRFEDLQGYSEILRIANTQATHLRERSIRPHPRWLIFERFTGRPAVIPGYRVTRKFQQFGTGKMGFAEINSDVLEADFDRADLFQLWLFSDFLHLRVTSICLYPRQL
jgi:hypothetical protein